MRPERQACRIMFMTTISLLASLVCTSALWAAGEGPIDWQKARELLRRQQQGQVLSSEEAAYLARARQQRAAGQRPRGRAQMARETTGMVPPRFPAL